MKDIEISNRLRAISMEDWEEVFKKCYGHVYLKLRNRTKKGAHCEQRLGMSAVDYYVGNACKALFEQTWTWQYEEIEILPQMIRVIDSMISNEVRKYKVEQKQNKQLPILVSNDGSLDEMSEDDPEISKADIQFFQKCSTILDKAIEDNAKHKQFVNLKRQGKDYDVIAGEMKCTPEELYQMMETIARRARKLLKAEK